MEIVGSNPTWSTALSLGNSVLDTFTGVRGMVVTSRTLRKSHSQESNECHQGPVAQMVEQGTEDPRVAGSIPARPTQNAGMVEW